MRKVSVIIPVYNVEKYLPRCLDSVLAQTVSNVEIICVNDKTPDDSGKILAEYARKDDRFKIITHEHNKGLSAARNSGMRIASGEYLYFLDSDDYIERDYLEKMICAMEKNNLDVVLNLNILSEADGKSAPYIHPSFKEVSPQGEFVPRERAIHDFPFNVWARLYRKIFLDTHNITFPEGYVSEDVYFHYLTHVYCDTSYVFSGPNYHYTSRAGSITKKEHNLDLFVTRIYDLVFDYFSRNGLLNKYEIKMFHVFPYFSVDSEEKFWTYSRFFSKINNHLISKKYLYNELELFFAHCISESKNFEEYTAKFHHSVALNYIRKTRN